MNKTMIPVRFRRAALAAVGLWLLAAIALQAAVLPAAKPESVGFSPERLERLSRIMQEAVDSGQIRQFTGNEYTGPLSKGDLIAAMAWSGDIVQLQADNDALRWGIPESGGMIWTDNMLIPLGGDVGKASQFMNFVYDPVIAAQIAAYVNYVPPVEGVKEELAKLDPALAENPLIVPDDATLAKVSGFDSEALNNQDYIEQWQALLGA